MEVIPLHLSAQSHRAQIGCNQFETIALLHTQFPHFAKDRLACRATREHGEHRHLVHQRWDLGSGDFCPFERRGPDEQIGDRLPAFIPQIDSLDVRTHAFEDNENTRPRRVHADVLYEQLAAVRKHRRRNQKRGARNVTGNGKLDGRMAGWAVGRFENDRSVALVNSESEICEQALGVITRPVRLRDFHRDLAGQSRKQDRALHLRARNGTRIRQPAELAPADREGKPIPSFLNIRAHLFERLRHTPHRAPAERRISRERRGERLAG